MKKCRICSGKAPELLDFGMQPVSNRYLKLPTEAEYKQRLVMMLCNNCGLVQLENPFPAHELQPKYDWISYNEPEQHLDDMAEMISKLPKISKDAAICGVSYKDGSLIERMRRLGFKNAMRLEFQGISDAKRPLGVETIQHLLDSEKAKEIVRRHGRFDVIVARHIMEHSEDISCFMNSLKILLNPNGYIIFEVPDCTKPIEMLDYSMPWEEHNYYFTPETFRNIFSFMGFDIISMHNFPYTMENSLVAAVSPNNAVKPKIPGNNELSVEIMRALNYSKLFSQNNMKLASFLSDFKKNIGKIAIFGAGHTSAALINLFELEKHICWVIDDNKNKQEFLMPGSHLKIKGSNLIYDGNIQLCILSVSPAAEEKIISKHIKFTENGGLFLSFCPASRNFILNHIKNEIDGLSKLNDEVYYADKDIVNIGRKDVQFLVRAALQNKSGRCRICCHKNVNDKLHEMIIVLRKDIYIRPHKHLGRTESFHIIEGSADIIIFDDEGAVKEIVRMGDFQSGKTAYYRMNRPYFHSLIINSDYLAFHEITSGPFKKSGTIMAEWSPKEESADAANFLDKLRKSLKSSR